MIAINRYIEGSILPEPEDLYFTEWKKEPRNHRKRITDKEIAFILYLYNKGYSYRDMAERTGRTVEAIRHVIHDYPKKSAV